jgi:hypothetical protein
MQIAVPYLLPMFCIVSLVSLLKIEHPLLTLVASPLWLGGGLAFGQLMRVAARTAAAASKRPVPRWLYALAGPCFLALMVELARLSYAQSHAAGNAAFSIILGFLAFYCAIGGVLALGRAVVRGPRRLAFWVFLPRWLDSPTRPAEKRTAQR